MHCKTENKTFEEYVGEDKVYNYVAIRIDKERVDYKSLKTTTLQNILLKFPFKEDGITKDDVFRILEASKLGLPDYYI